MDIVEFIRSLNLVDLVIGLFLFAMFVLGFIQGTIRRLVGILSIVFSFFLAAQLSVPFGDFLAQNWTQYPHEYSVMIGFRTIFVAGVIAFTLVDPGHLREGARSSPSGPIIDEILGGVLGLVQGFAAPDARARSSWTSTSSSNRAGDADEIQFLRDVWTAIDGSGVRHPAAHVGDPGLRRASCRSSSRSTSRATYGL